MGTKVFISWSKARSKRIATALRDWIPNVLQTVEPFMSEKDIDAGRMWNDEVSKRLEDSSFGIICITADNRAEPWLLFEAGALAKNRTVAKVVPYLHGLEFVHLAGSPLNSFQGAQTSGKEGTYKIVQSINAETEAPLPDARLGKAFDLWWPALGEDLKKVDADQPENVPKSPEPVALLSEVLSIVRGLRDDVQALRVNIGPTWGHVQPLNLGAMRAETSRRSLATADHLGELIEKMEALDRPDIAPAIVELRGAVERMRRRNPSSEGGGSP